MTETPRPMFTDKALKKAIQEEITKEKESLALASVDTLAKLQARLMQARSVLSFPAKKYFDVFHVNRETKSLVGRQGYSLQWLLRRHPHLPESYDNQQTTKGTVILHIEA